MKFSRVSTRLVGVTTMLLLGACSGAGATDSATIAATVKANAEGVVAAFNAHDAAKAAAYDAPDYVGLMHGTDPVSGMAADEAGMKLQLEDPAMNWTISDGSVTVAKAGDMAVYQARYVFTYTDADSQKPVTERGNWVAIFRQQDDGSMKLWRSLAIDTGAATPPPAS